MQQLITPNPDIPCTPGYCLMYVREAAGLPARYASATEAWNNSTSQHPDTDFPPGLWVPVWYGLDREPLGHVVWLAPDGSVYSTSDNSTTPHHHPSLADLEAYYAGWGWPLTYRGWTEDVAGYPVITDGGIAAMGSTTIQEDDMATPEEYAHAVWSYINSEVETRDAYQILRDTPKDTVDRQVPHKDPVTGLDDGQTTSLATMAGYADFQANQTRLNTDAKTVAASIPDGIAQDVINALAARLGGK